jgi:ATP-binding cassette subfamily B protein
MGRFAATGGQLRIDGVPLDYEKICALRQQTVWVDPTVKLWNRSLLYNLRYGHPPGKGAGAAGFSFSYELQQADLFSVLEKLPQGLQTILGEDGGLVSGGEGQRVRLGRALLHTDPRLVILDEPFRGLDREKRRALIVSARQQWAATTLIFISHDVGESQAFKRVVVLEKGKIIEDAAPATLLANPQSRYSALLKAEAAVQAGLWQGANWRRWWLEGGRLTERAPNSEKD